MNEINEQFLFPLWGHTITEQKIDLTSSSIHFTLFATDGGKEIKTQVDIENIRMFCYGTDECYDGGSSFPKSAYAGAWTEVTEIEAAKPGLANVKVYFNYSKEVPSPYFSADQNIVIDFPNAVLTVSAEKVIINGTCFVWSSKYGCFERQRDGSSILTESQKDDDISQNSDGNK